ncbi:hypothetical protein [Streptomyces tibetensis]|uniref:hypothetical protein n=1 Tax=Streptomyces tibetensis TaxID=2382123 RepID=UPI0033FD640F
MGSYAGPVRVIADGVPYEGTARLVPYAECKALVADPLGDQGHLYGTEPTWVLVIHARTAADAWAIRQADELVIRTNEGREGRFTVIRGGDFSSSDLQIAGGGRAPFGDEAGAVAVP